jgi:DNA-binding LytR/AlgR family response regulator
MNIKEGTIPNDTPLRVVFCDSDSSHIKQYAHVVQQICKVRGIPAKTLYYPKGIQLLADLMKNKEDPTIVIAETELSAEGGLHILRQIHDVNPYCKIIILSQNPTYALEGYEIGAVAYLLKKATTLELFTRAFSRALDASVESTQRYITFSCAGHTQTVRLTDILYFEVVRKIVTVHHAGGTFDFYSTLGKIEDVLASYGFIRVHRNYVVSLSKIARQGDNELVLDSGMSIPVGRNYRKSVIAAMKSLNGLGA